MADDNTCHQLDSYGKQRADELAHLTDKTQEAGLIPASAVKPEDGVVESSASVGLMIRVAKALVRPSRVQDRMAEGGEREATPYEKLAMAGCPPEVYDQLVGHPEFKTIYMKVIEASVFLPSLPDAARSVRTKAVAGDKDAWANMTKAMRLDENPDEDGLRAQIRSWDQATFLRSCAEHHKKQGELLGELTAPMPTDADTDALLEDEEGLAALPDVPTIDHASIHGDS